MPRQGFPKLIFVTREHGQGRGETWLAVHEDGLPDLAETEPCAMYQLVRRGRVEVNRKFVETGRALKP